MSDLSMLRWRIEQQSEVIMKLKCDLDKSTLKLKDQEKINTDILNVNNLVHSQVKEGEEKIKDLENEFSQVHTAFEKLVKVKEQIKASNVALQNEISKFENENKMSISSVIAEKTQKVQETNKLIYEAQVLLGQLDTQYSQLTISNEADVLQQEKELLTSIHSRTMSELEKMLNDVTTDLQATTRRIEHIKQKRLKLLDERTELTEKYENENEEFVILIDEKTGKIKEEKILHDQLEEQKEKLIKDLALAENRFVSEKVLIHPDMLIEKLTGELNASHVATENALREFSAYQKHVEKLITREQQLNKKFKMLSS